MVTTIQIDERTLLLLKRLKQELNAISYNEAITKIALQRSHQNKIGGILKEDYKKGELKRVLKELQDERRKSDRF
jgi:hypothetical protein